MNPSSGLDERKEEGLDALLERVEGEVRLLDSREKVGSKEKVGSRERLRESKVEGRKSPREVGA